MGVYCSSLKRVCNIIKKHCLEDDQSIPRVSRKTPYDGIVTPCYGSYPMKTEACANITRRDFNPPNLGLEKVGETLQALRVDT